MPFSGWRNSNRRRLKGTRPQRRIGVSMAFLNALSAYIHDGTDHGGRPRHLSAAPPEMLSVHQMVEAAARQIDPGVLSEAADGMAASFHCGSLYQGEHFWPIQN